jgi:hypothetical protein
MQAPDVYMRGPSSTPLSICLRKPWDIPQRSRTVVTPAGRNSRADS